MTQTSTRRDAATHGTRRMYQLGCRCLRCAVTESRYQQLWNAGGKARRPVRIVLDHVARLEASGWTRTEIIKAAGLGTSTLWHMASGRQKTVNSRTANAVLALQPHPTDVDLSRLARKVAHRHAADHRLVLSRSDIASACRARWDLLWVLRSAGWSCTAAADLMHRNASWASHYASRAQVDDHLRALIDLAPEPPEEVVADLTVDSPTCEDCDDTPMGGGRWCYPHYLEHRRVA